MKYDLARFIDAQEGVFERALQELTRGRKQSHWMWFIFPQVSGLGHSPMAQRYAIRSKGEALAYLEHEVLGQRLRQCAAALLAYPDRNITAIMGSPDDMKLRSSLTLFAAISPPDSVFARVLAHFYTGRSDEFTTEFLEKNP